MKNLTVSACVAGLLLMGNASAIDMPVLAKKEQCNACHSIDKPMYGPSWMDIAKRYQVVTTYTYNGVAYPLEQGLLLKISKGGSGDWGTVPMIGFDLLGVKQEELKTLLQFILGLPAT